MTDKSVKWYWITKIAIPIITVVLSVATSWSISLYTIKHVLRDETKQGQIVYEDIGYRYFFAIYDLYDKTTFTLKPVDDRETWDAYGAILDDILSDIRWLRTNPMYGRIPEEFSTFPFVQNLLAKEKFTSQGGVINDGLLSLMCDLYVSSRNWQSGRNKYKELTVVFAKRRCDQRTSS